MNPEKRYDLEKIIGAYIQIGGGMLTALTMYHIILNVDPAGTYLPPPEPGYKEWIKGTIDAVMNAPIRITWADIIGLGTGFYLQSRGIRKSQRADKTYEKYINKNE